MKIEQVEQFHIQMPLKHPFETSFGMHDVLDKVITAVHAEGLVGWGEAPVDRWPYYSPETHETVWYIQNDYLIPTLLANSFDHATSLPALFDRVRGHPMAKAGIEAAVWDLEAKMAEISVSDLLGGTRARVKVGVSIGIQESVEALLERIQAFREEGYRRIKIKIKPGWDAEIVSAVREEYPGIALMVDANSAYTLEDAKMLKALDGFNLLMIEQPLAHDDIIEHAELQKQLKTPVCLDESIHTVGRAREALAMESCQIINIKPSRVGGLTNSRRIHDLCQVKNIPVWCGGMLETGIGRASNLAVASLPNFTLPGDISATDRYWDEDIIDHEFTLNPDGTMTVPIGPGIGVEVVRDRLESVTAKKVTYTAD